MKPKTMAKNSFLWSLANCWTLAATEVQEELVRNRHKRVKHVVSSVHTMPVSVNKEFKESQTKNNKDNGHTEED